MASYKIYFLDFFHKNMLSSSKIRPLKLQNAIVEADFMKKVDFGCFLRGCGYSSSVEQLQFLLAGSHCVFHGATVGPGAHAILVGDDVSAAAGYNPILSHSHLALDGDTTHWCTGAHERVEV